MRSSAAVAMQEPEGTQNQTKAIKPNSCYETDRRVNDMADPERGNYTHYDRYEDGKTNPKEVDDVARLAVHSEESDFEHRLSELHASSPMLTARESAVGEGRRGLPLSNGKMPVLSSPTLWRTS